MARYRLLAAHVTSDGRVLSVGTEVGDGTPEPWGDPSGQMDPLDDEAVKKVKKFHEDRYGEEGWANFERAMEARKVSQATEEVKGPPVSKQQAEERGREPPKGKEPLMSDTAAPSPQVRPRVSTERGTVNPNKDQYPKDG